MPSTKTQTSKDAIEYTAQDAGQAADHLLAECFPTAQLDIRSVRHCMQYAIDTISLRLAVPNFVSPSVTFFGSSRNVSQTTRDAVKNLAAEAAKLGLSVGTGGGPNIMSDANQGAYEVNPKLSWSVPHGGLKNEAPNSYFEASRGIAMYDFPQRVEGLSDDVLTAAYVINKGGFGTLEERTQVLAFMKEQTIQSRPIILFNEGGFWSDIDRNLERLIIDEEKRALFKSSTIISNDTTEIVEKLGRIEVQKPSDRENFTFQDNRQRTIEDLTRPYEKIDYGFQGHTSNDSIADLIEGVVKDRLTSDQNASNMQIAHSNIFIKLLLDSLASVASQDVFSGDTVNFNKNVTLFGSQENNAFGEAQEATLAAGNNIFYRLEKLGCKVAPGHNQGEIKRWQGLATVSQNQSSSFDNFRLTFRRRTSSAATALRISSRALFLPGGHSTLKLAMKALCWAQTQQMHPTGSGKEFTPIFVGEPWAQISANGKVSGALPEVVKTLVENNCIAPEHASIPKFARDTEEALAGKLHTFKI